MPYLGRVVVGLVHIGDGPVRGGGGRVVVLAVLVLQPSGVRCYVFNRSTLSTTLTG